MTPASGFLILTLALHAYHARCHLYHHPLLSLLCLGALPPHPIPALLSKSMGYFIAVTVLGDVQRAIRGGEVWLLYLPSAAVLLFLVSFLWGGCPRFLACLAGVAGLHCLFFSLYWG